MSSPEARFGVGELERFYRGQAPLYDWTRPFFLFGRGALLEGLEVRPGQLVLDVGCGTGWSFARLARRGARVEGVEVSEPMRRRALAQGEVPVDDRPYGSHDHYRGRLDRILFSYSLSMIPPFREAVASARLDLRPGGVIGVVDFLDARGVFDAWLRRSCVFPGMERLDALKEAFPTHRSRIRDTRLWRYYQFWGRV